MSSSSETSIPKAASSSRTRPGYSTSSSVPGVEEREQSFAEVRGEAHELVRRRDRSRAGLRDDLLDEGVVPDEIHQRRAPVEEDGLQHGVVR